jgi:ABC-type Fe3+-hydroxamate transport system substrate-binding protein
MKFCALLILALSVGCSSEQGDSLDVCAERRGTYQVKYSYQDGTCSAPANEIVSLSSQPTTESIKALGCTGPIDYSADNCMSSCDTMCPAANGGVVRTVGQASWTRDAKSGTAIERKTVFLNGIQTCSGRIKAVWEKI